jgi:hypothetical protein
MVAPFGLGVGLVCSFSEEKEPKRLFAALRGGCWAPKLGASPRQPLKSLFLL